MDYDTPLGVLLDQPGLVRKEVRIEDIEFSPFSAEYGKEVMGLSMLRQVRPVVTIREFDVDQQAIFLHTTHDSLEDPIQTQNHPDHTHPFQG